MEPKLFLLDAMALIYRAYYAMIKSPRRTSKGVNTSAILGFTNTLYDIIKNEKPTHIAVSFDTGSPTLRHADFEAYKANRESTPEDIINSIPFIKRIIEAFNIPILLMDGYEADDIIGTVAKHAEIKNFKVYMMTSDKDYGQLVSERIFIYKPAKFGQKAEVIGVNEICAKYEIERPEQLIDILGLWGDSSDNIPGVPNIGEVKAKKLIKEFGSIENIYQSIDQVDNEKLKQLLIDHQEQALLSKMLATIILDVPIDYDFNLMKYQGPDLNSLTSIFNELEFRTLLQRVLKDYETLHAGNIPNQTGDLFSPILEIPQMEPISLFSNFKQRTHDFRPILNVEEFKNLNLSAEKPLFFEWITWENRMTGFTFSTSESVVYYHFFENKHEYYLTILQSIFENEFQIVTCNVKTFYKYFKVLKIAPKTQFFDLQIAHYLIEPEQNHALEKLSETYLHYSMMTLNKEELQSSISKEKLMDIAGEKVEIYAQIFPLIKKELDETKSNLLFQNIEMPLAEVLADMEYTGITLDTQILAQNAEELTKEIQELEAQIHELAGMEFNIASPKQLGEVLFKHLHIIENAKLTKTKQYQTGEEILAKLVHKHPIIPLILDYRTLTKLKSTYIDNLPLLVNPKTKRIHTTFNQFVTSTGRLSSVNPNLQNIPIRTKRGKEVRKAFVAATSDMEILSADYSQIELRIVASVSEDQSMMHAFMDQHDIHTATAARVYNVPLEEVSDAMRRQAKTVNFGILYGISAFGLADRLRIPQKEASELIKEYFKNFPKIKEYLDKTLEFAKNNGYVETLLGRRRYIQDITSQNSIVRKSAERNAINAPIQGSAADLIKIAMISIFKELKNRKMKTKMLLQVHDELIFEVPKDELETATVLIQKLMTEALQLRIPLAVDIKHGKSWYEAH